MNPMEKLLELAGESREVISRNMTCKVHSVHEGALAISRMADEFHEMTLAILVDRHSFEITRAHAQIKRAPYRICATTESTIEKLVGLSIYHRAVRREARRRTGRKEGCTHLFELVEFTLASLFSGAPLAGLENSDTPHKIAEMDPEEHRRLHIENPWLRNTCRAFVPDEEQ